MPARRQLRRGACAPGPVYRGLWRTSPTQRAFLQDWRGGGRTCACNGNPKRRFDDRLKQDPRWKAGQRPDGTLGWTTPSGRQYTTEPTRYPT